MRLTLRTLLAYRDGVLDTKDAILLESKLRDSVTAQQISRRIDEGMSNPRLAPIPVDAKEFGFDPNHIAEYLDDTIPVEQIPAMERCCLENNALLSEVGSCHRVLTKALASPVEVSRELRDRVLAMPMTPNVKPSRLRILRLGKDGNSVRFDAPTVSKFEVAYSSQPDSPANLVNESSTLPAVRLSSNEPRGSGIELSEGLGHQVPEYLIGYDRSWLRTTLVGSLLVAALVIVGVLAIGPVDQLQSMLSVENRVANPDASSSQTKETVSNKKLEDKGEAKQETNANNLPANESPRGDVSNSKVVESDSTQPTLPSTPPEESLVDGNATNVVDRDNEERTNADNGNGSTTETKIDPDMSAENPKKDSILNADVPSERPAIVDETSREFAIKWLPESKQSSDSLVIYSNPVDPESSWQRANPGSQLSIGDVIVAPYQRTEMVTKEGIRLIVCDASQIECKGANPVSVPYGKFILFPTPSGNVMNVSTPSGSFQITFQDAISSCAMEVRHTWSETTSEEIANSRLNTKCETKLYGIQGTVVVAWKEKEQAGSVELAVGEVASVMGTESISKSEMESAPAWFRTSTTRSIDQFAWQDAIKFLKKEESKPLLDTLKELSQSKRAETASFAVRVLCQLGRFDSLVGSSGFLSRKGAYTHLQTWLPELPGFLGNKESMDAFLLSAETNLASRRNDVMRLLVTHSATQLKEGGERLLIESLSSTQQDERLLAIVQLSTLTGKTLGFHPEKSSPESVSQWRKLLVKEESRPSQSN